MVETLAPLTPVHFFAIGIDCHYFKGKSSQLPQLSPLTGDKQFAEVAVGWNEKGLYVDVTAKRPRTEVFFPDITSGDSVELFIDTRDVKNRTFNTRFCHHFFFLPQPVDTNGASVQAGEITRFRTEDSHELCDPEALVLSCDQTKKGYTLHIFIPAHVLHGYDPSQFDRIGFTYRINRYDAPPQHFSLSSEDFSIEQHSSNWATMKLVKEKTK